MLNSTKAEQGLFFILIGPAGAGKSSVATHLVELLGSRGKMAVSVTSRAPRPKEVHGEHYFFCSREQFKKDIGQGLFFEWEETHGNLYGTPQEQIDHVIQKAGVLVLDIDVRGANTFQSKFPKFAYQLLLLPPSAEDLVNRIKNRGGLAQGELQKRLNTSIRELDSFKDGINAGQIRSIVINKDLQETRNIASRILLSLIEYTDNNQEVENFLPKLDLILNKEASLKQISDLREQVLNWKEF